MDLSEEFRIDIIHDGRNDRSGDLRDDDIKITMHRSAANDHRIAESAKANGRERLRGILIISSDVGADVDEQISVLLGVIGLIDLLARISLGGKIERAIDHIVESGIAGLDLSKIN